MTDKKQGYQPETGIATNTPNCGSGVQPPNTGRLLIDIPADGNYIEILGHRIDGFESFEAFLEHLKKYAVLEETVKTQNAYIERLRNSRDRWRRIAENFDRATREEEKAGETDV